MSKIFDHIDNSVNPPPITAEERLLQTVRQPTPRDPSPRPDPAIESLSAQLRETQSLAQEKQEAYDRINAELARQRETNAELKTQADNEIAALNQALAATASRSSPPVGNASAPDSIQTRIADLEFQIELLQQQLRLSELRREQQQTFAHEERDRRRHAETRVLKTREPA